VDIALISVLASSVVALGALISQGLTQRGQRKHDSSLAFEQRAWDRKADALFLSIGAARDLTDALAARLPTVVRGYGPARRIVESLQKFERQIADTVPLIAGSSPLSVG
jgi:hypothetical protein